MNVIPCTTWVRRGVAAAVPDKVWIQSGCYGIFVEHNCISDSTNVTRIGIDYQANRIWTPVSSFPLCKNFLLLEPIDVYIGIIILFLSAGNSTMIPNPKMVLVPGGIKKSRDRRPKQHPMLMRWLSTSIILEITTTKVRRIDNSKEKKILPSACLLLSELLKYTVNFQPTTSTAPSEV